jgi:hypothetical protein
MKKKNRLAVLKKVLTPGKCCRGGHCTCKLSCNCGCQNCVCSGGFK